MRADGLRVEFPPLRTLDAVPGNLPVQTTSFVGREVAVKELAEQVRAHRLVTLTGVGGVGKTRLAMQVAAELTGEFSDGVWLVEFAPVGDPAAVPDTMAAVLGVTPQAGLSVTASIAQALSGRRLLLVLDNCEHVLDAAADVVEQLLAHTDDGEGDRYEPRGITGGIRALVAGSVARFAAGVESAAVALFVERAEAVNPAFELDDDADAMAAVIEICRRLDGIALAIELAAARMVSMSAQDVRDRLGDRFRLLAGSRRGLERHQTLHHAVAWSYDLLDDDERTVLQRCSVFAGGFDVAAATAISRHVDEYAVLDVLDSLVRKSLVTVERRRRPRPLRDVGDDPPVRRGTTGRHRRRSTRSAIVTPPTSRDRPSPMETGLIGDASTIIASAPMVDGLSGGVAVDTSLLFDGFELPVR